MSITPWVAVDFDNTLVNVDVPLPGAKEAMERLKDLGYAIMIHSCNNKAWIARVLRAHDIPFDYIWDGAEDKGKPACNFYVDDRAVGFRGDWSKVLEEIEHADASSEAREK